MSLKFTFGGSSHNDHDDHGHGHGAAPSGVPLPFAGASSSGPMSGSSVLKLHVSLRDQLLVCEGLSGDGVSYARAEVSVEGRPLSQALRSVLARAGAELPEPLLGSVTEVSLDLGPQSAEALEGLGLGGAAGSGLGEGTAAGGTQLAAVDDALQARTGIAAGTPITRA